MGVPAFADKMYVVTRRFECIAEPENIAGGDLEHSYLGYYLLGLSYFMLYSNESR
jgi:hypothetical protein